MRIAFHSQHASEWFWRVVPLLLVITVAGLAVANQIVNPHPRLVKVTVLFLLLVIMLRLEVIYSLYVFILLMPFPSGIALSSTNVVLMTIIPLLWAIRAASSRQALLARTPVDRYILFFLLAYVASFFNSESSQALTMNIKMLWRQLAALGFFYLIATFVTDEKKLSQITKMIALGTGLLSLTAFIELFAPGSALIPGWISAGDVNYGELGIRIEGIRLGGNVGSHSLLGDYLSLGLFFIGFHFLRARNPIENVIWIIFFAISFTSVLATANRGAFVALIVGIVYSFWVFRRHLSPVRFALITTTVIALFVSVQIILNEFTYAASATERLLATEFEGVVPNNRGGAWLPALAGSTDHIFIGHGAWYDVGIGFDRKAWPHNAYIFNLYTLGILGLSAMLLIRYRLFRISFDCVRAYPPGTGRGTASNMMGILHVQFVMHLLHMGRTDFERAGDFVYIFIVWMLFGLIAAAGNILKKPSEPAG